MIPFLLGFALPLTEAILVVVSMWHFYWYINKRTEAKKAIAIQVGVFCVVVFSIMIVNLFILDHM